MSNRTKKIHQNLKRLGLNRKLIMMKMILDNTEIVLINYYGAVKTYLETTQNVFIGKSILEKLKRVGGQNPIEAAKKVVLYFMVPLFQTFAEIYELFQKKRFF